MLRLLGGALVASVFFTAGVAAQEGNLKGKIKKIDADKRTITITVGDKDYDLTVAENARFEDAGSNPLKDGLKNEKLKAGAAVAFRRTDKDGKAVLTAMKLAAGSRVDLIRQPPPKVDQSKVKPLTDMGRDDEYKGFKGGLYPAVKNERPADHEATGVALAKQVQPLDAKGEPSPDGKIVLLTIGMSNTNQASSGFLRMVKLEKDLNPKVTIVNGAIGGMTAGLIQREDASRTFANGKRVVYWPEVDNILKKEGATPAQVQAVWLKQADPGPEDAFPKHAQTLQAELVKIVQIMHKRYPNLKLVYISSRVYGGWAKTRLNPEPFAYEGGFSVKWLIEQQIKGDPELNYDPKKGAVKAPWLSWGPYLWANGTTKRADGFSYEENDLREDDRTHESVQGQDKVGKLLVQFFKNDSTTKGWFVAKPR